MKEGRKLKSVDPINAITAYIMPDRTGASNQFIYPLDITETEKFIRQKRAEGKKGFGLMHIMLAAYVRTACMYPGINRYIRGQKIYAHNSIDMCLTIKKDFTLDGKETVIKIPATPLDTIDNIYDTTAALVDSNKDMESSNGTDSVARLLQFIPGVLLKFVVWFLKLLDYFGLLPGFLVKVSPFHASMFITNIGSLGIPPIYHHLYDFGTIPIFFSFGTKRTENYIDSEGNVCKRRMVDVTVVCDERICDGHYYASAFKQYKRLVENPEKLSTKL